MGAPLILPVKDELVMIRYSQTLTLYLHRQLLNHLLSAASIDMPIYFYYMRRRGGPMWTVFGPFKVTVIASHSSVYKVTRAESDDEEDVFAGIPMIPAYVSGAGSAEPLCRLAGGRSATLKIVEVLEAPRVMEYIAVNGRRYRAVWLRGAAAAKVVGGYKVGSAPQAVIVNPPPGTEPGDVLEACWVAMKAGRGDFHETGTSHQLNIYVVV